jgi:hypothetical protein
MHLVMKCVDRIDGPVFQMTFNDHLEVNRSRTNGGVAWVIEPGNISKYYKWLWARRLDTLNTSTNFSHRPPYPDMS